MSTHRCPTYEMVNLSYQSRDNKVEQPLTALVSICVRKTKELTECRGSIGVAGRDAVSRSLSDNPFGP